MSDDKIVEFKPKNKKPKANKNPYDIDSITVSMDDVGLKFTKEALDRLLSDMTAQDAQLNTLANDLFELQLLVEKHPEIAQFVSAHIKKLTESMKDRLKNI